MKIGRVTLSDRAYTGAYEDLGGPEIEKVTGELLGEGLVWIRKLLPDDLETIKSALIELSDLEKCDIIITTGGTGPSERDVTPEATLAVIGKEFPGFGEVMRRTSFEKVSTAILSRATAGIRGSTFILNLPGKPSAIRECMEPLIPAIHDIVKHLSRII